MTIRISANRLDLGNARIDNANMQNYAENINAIGNTSTSCTIDLSLGNAVTATLTGNCTFTFSNPPASGRMGSFTLLLTNDGSAGRTTTWPAAVKWPGGSQPSRDTAASAINIYSFITFNGGTTWFGVLGGRGMA